MASARDLIRWQDVGLTLATMTVSTLPDACGRRVLTMHTERINSGDRIEVVCRIRETFAVLNQWDTVWRSIIGQMRAELLRRAGIALRCARRSSATPP